MGWHIEEKFSVGSSLLVLLAFGAFLNGPGHTRNNKHTAGEHRIKNRCEVLQVFEFHILKSGSRNIFNLHGNDETAEGKMELTANWFRL